MTGKRLRAVILVLPLVLFACACSLEDEPFVSFDTYDGDPDWSPDGRTIAFVSSRRGGGIFLIGREGDAARLVVRGEASDVDWSPDGRMIAFVRTDGIYVVKASGGRPKRVLRGRDEALSSPAWSPRGDRLAFTKQNADFTSAIYVVRLDGRGVRRLLPKFRGAVRDAAPGSPAALTEREPAWSPDGSEIAFQAGDGQIVAARISDGHRRTIVDRGYGYEPAWTPDGKLIAYQCEGELCVVDADGSGETAKLATDGGDPSWAPDSEMIVFEHYLYNDDAEPQSLSLIDVSSGDSAKLTYGPTRPALP